MHEAHVGRGNGPRLTLIEGEAEPSRTARMLADPKMTLAITAAVMALQELAALAADDDTFTRPVVALAALLALRLREPHLLARARQRRPNSR